MGCCGRNRQILKTENETATVRRPVRLPTTASNNLVAGTTQPSTAPPVFVAHSVRLLYLSTPPLMVRGAGTGRQYLFSRSQPEQAVDVRDFEGLLRTGRFRKA